MLDMRQWVLKFPQMRTSKNACGCGSEGEPTVLMIGFFFRRRSTAAPWRLRIEGGAVSHVFGNVDRVLAHAVPEPSPSLSTA